MNKDFRKCIKRSCIDANFSRITPDSYRFNQRFNSCWGAKIAITADGKIRPCIYSQIWVAHVQDIQDNKINGEAIIQSLKGYWQLTKDLVDTCCVCELRHICYDCREIARLKNGDIKSANPLCKYDPYRGVWLSQ